MKNALHRLLAESRFAEIAALAAAKKRVLGALVSLSFDPDPLIGWRAVEAMGWAAARIAADNPQYVRSHLQRLQWLLSEESGGLCWRAPEAMAEIVRRQPHLFADYIPIIVFMLTSFAEEDLVHFRGGILWAIGRLGPLTAEHATAVLPAIAAALDDPNPQSRGMAVWCLAQLGQAKILARRPELGDDQGAVALYEHGQLRQTEVRRLVRDLRDQGAAAGGLPNIK